MLNVYPHRSVAVPFHQCRWSKLTEYIFISSRKRWINKTQWTMSWTERPKTLTSDKRQLLVFLVFLSVIWFEPWVAQCRVFYFSGDRSRGHNFAAAITLFAERWQTIKQSDRQLGLGGTLAANDAAAKTDTLSGPSQEGMVSWVHQAGGRAASIAVAAAAAAASV